MSRPNPPFLPVSKKECIDRGWDCVDIVLVTGDAYIDHPSFGIALIARLLESRGYRVAILPQPRFDCNDDFKRFGKPRLFFGITAGNLDSIVANYSSHGKVRDQDSYSDGGNPYRSDKRDKANRRRPDRASLIYAQLARSAYKETPIVLGGLEASLRRFIHFDYKQNKLRGSVLTDSKADVLIYGMGEKGVLDTAQRLSQDKNTHDINGSCIRLTEKEFEIFITTHAPSSYTFLPSWVEIQNKKDHFLEAELLLDKLSRAEADTFILQKQKAGYVLQNPAQKDLTQQELDDLYALPFTRKPHPLAGDIPAYRMICHSVTTMRGCSGNCSFCAITRHQGASVVSRSKKSIIDETKKVVQMDNFTGTISDLGGPTANLYGSKCLKESCSRKDCLYPTICRHLEINEQEMLDLLEDVSNLDGVNHLFISSGLRMELLLKTPRLMKKIVSHHTPGMLKIAPEHTEDIILQLMHKEKHSILGLFIKRFREIGKTLSKPPVLSPYFITGHPGSNERSARELGEKTKKLGLTIKQFQDFTPTPGTLSTAMHVSGLDTKKRKISVPNPGEMANQRRIVEKLFFKKNRKRRKRK